MNAERLELMCREILNNKELPPAYKLAVISLYLREYREWAERQLD